MADNVKDLANNDEELRKMFMESSNLGTEDVSGGIPVLKIYQKNVTPADNLLATGEEPTDGYFYHKATGLQFEDITAHLLVISRGYWSWTQKDKDGNQRVRYGQIAGGIILNEGLNIPFLTYVYGVKWPFLNEFSKDVSRYTKRKNNPLPLYAMLTMMEKVNVKTANGIKYATQYTLVKNDIGEPEYVKDITMIKMLIGFAGRFKDEIQQIIDRVEVDKSGNAIIAEDRPVSAVVSKADDIGPTKGVMPDGSAEEVVDSDDLPF